MRWKATAPWASTSLSVALQAANVAIAVGGLQRLRLEQLSADLPMSPGQGGCPSGRLAASLMFMPANWT